jgi:hypothetical protein
MIFNGFFRAVMQIIIPGIFLNSGERFSVAIVMLTEGSKYTAGEYFAN